MTELNSCNDCGSKVSPRASMCPACGAPLWRDRMAHRASSTLSIVRASRTFALMRHRLVGLVAIAGFCTLLLGMLPFKGEGLSLGDHRNEIGAPLDSHFHYAARFYSVLGRAFPPRFDETIVASRGEPAKVELTQLFQAFQADIDANGHVYTGTFDVNRQIMLRATSEEHLIAMVKKARLLHDQHVTFIRGKNARRHILLVTILEGLLAALVIFGLKTILLYRAGEDVKPPSLHDGAEPPPANA